MDPSKRKKLVRTGRAIRAVRLPYLLQSRRDVQGAPATRDTLCGRSVQEQSCEHGHHGRARVHPLAHGPSARGAFARGLALGPFARGPFARGLALGPFALGPFALGLALGPFASGPFALGLALGPFALGPFAL